MEENNLQQSQQNQQPAQNEQANTYGQQGEQNGQANAYVQQPAQNGQANAYVQQPAQNGQANAYVQQPVQNGQANAYVQQPAQNGQANAYVQQPVQNGQVNAYVQQPVQNGQANAYVQQPVQNGQAYTYAQPPMQNPSPYMYGAPVQPVPAAGGGKKKKKTGLVIAIVLVAVIVAAIGIGIFVHASVSGSPETKLAKGFENLAKEMSAGETAILADIDYPAILKTLQTEGGSLDLSMNFTMPGEDTIGFDYIQNYDHVNKLMKADMIVSAYNISLLQMKLAADEDRLYLGMPGFISDTYYVNAATFGQEFNDSVWCDMLGLDGIEKDFALDLFPEPVEETADGWIFSEELKDLAKGITIEKGDSKEIAIGGKDVRCDGIRVRIDGEVVNDLLDELERELEKELASVGEAKADISFRLDSDVNLIFYLDNKNRIVCIETAEEIEIEDSNVEGVAFSFLFSGRDRTLDEVSGKITFTTPDDTPYIELEGKSELTATEYNSTFTMIFGDKSDDVGTISCDVTWDLKNLDFEAVYKVYDDIEEFAFEIKGGFENIEKGKSATFRLGQLKISVDGEEICRFSGSLTIGPLTDKIEMPSGAVNFLKMDQADILGLINEIYENIMNNPWEDPWSVSPL